MIDLEKPTIVGYRYSSGGDMLLDHQKAYSLPCDDLMTVAQHERIVARLLELHENAHNSAREFMKTSVQDDLLEKAAHWLEVHAPSGGSIEQGIADELRELTTSPHNRNIGQVEHRRLIGWRSDNYLWETSDPEVAKNWEPNIGVLPIFEGDPNTKLQAALAPVAVDDWQPSKQDYDRAIHHNPDAKAWADLFVATFSRLADKHDLMLGWFANAMMAMHDHVVPKQTRQDLQWAVSRWQAEVGQRPLVNVHRRALDDAWRQMIRHFGGDPDQLCGPSHDALLAQQQEGVQ